MAVFGGSGCFVPLVYFVFCRFMTLRDVPWPFVTFCAFSCPALFFFSPPLPSPPLPPPPPPSPATCTGGGHLLPKCSWRMRLVSGLSRVCSKASGCTASLGRNLWSTFGCSGSWFSRAPLRWSSGRAWELRRLLSSEW